MLIHKTFWRRLWGLNLPNKIKSFTWRVCLLRQRQVIDKARCEACGLGEESSGHVFWERGKAQEVWSLSGIVFKT